VGRQETVGPLQRFLRGLDEGHRLQSEQLAPYSLLATQIGLVADKWSAFLFGDNLTNKHAELGVNTSSFAFQAPSLVRVATNQPRTFGVDLTYRF
jgi:iron complex outermembrane recepter protein